MSSEPTTVILALDLGAAAKYHQRVFPLAYHDGLDGNINKGSLLLSATLEEMVKIHELGIDLSNNNKFFDTRSQYEYLAAERAKLQNNRKSLNPFKTFLNYRAARMFRAASSTLYLETKVASERIQRDQNLMQTVPSAEMHDVNNAVPADATITGIAINLPGGLDDGAIQTILDATNTIAAHNPKLNDEDEIMNLADTESLLNQPDAAGSAVEEDTGTPGLPGTSSDLQL